MTLAFKTLYDTVTLDADRRVARYKQGEVPFHNVAAVQVTYSPAGSYSAESYPVYLELRDGSRIEIASDAFGVARRAAVSAAEALQVPIHDLSFGKLVTANAEEWSLPLVERLRGRVVPTPGLESPGDDLSCSQDGDAVRFQIKPGIIGRTARRLMAELRAGDALDWTYTAVLTLCFLVPCLMVLPVVLGVYLVTRVIQGRPLAMLTASPQGVEIGGGIAARPPIPAAAVRDVGLFWLKSWRGRIRLQHLVVRSDDARLEFPVTDEAEAEWVRQHVLAALARR